MSTDFTYRMIVSWSDEDQLWLVEIPDLPGAMADGVTPEDAVQNARIIIAEWIEVALQDGRPIPDPRSSAASSNA
jgi:predicted RNase H-like HicB family nuclease